VEHHRINVGPIRPHRGASLDLYLTEELWVIAQWLENRTTKKFIDIYFAGRAVIE
jgi:hypothetical protein